MKKIMLNFLFVFLVCMILSNGCFAQPFDQAVLHFDATNKDSFELDQRDKIIFWKSLSDNSKFSSSRKELAPRLLKSTEGRKYNIVKFNGDDFLTLETKSGLEIGSMHLFIVAAIDNYQSAQKQYIFSAGDSIPQLNLYADGINYRFDTGLRRYKRRCGPKIDRELHLFEFSHFVPDDYNRIWPGDFYVDGNMCGKLFDRKYEIPLTDFVLGANKGKHFLKGGVGEILVFDENLSDARLNTVRSYLINKWGISANYKETAFDSLVKLKEARVGPAGKFSSFGIYNQSPESPDGSKIAYIVFDDIVNSENPLEYYELWICNSDLTGHKKVIDSPTPTTSHNGGFVQWIDNDSIAFCGTHGEKVSGKDTKRKIFVVNINTGNIEFGPYTNGFLSDNNYGGKILMNITLQSNIGPPGLYQLNTYKNRLKCFFKPEDFFEYKEKHKWFGRNDPNYWSFTHSKFSPDGKRIAFTVHTGPGGGQHLFISKAEGSDLKIWNRDVELDTGSDKPLHFFWYDNHSLLGVDQGTEDYTPNNLCVKVWDIDGNYIKTIAGRGCHIAISPNRKYVASENFYRTNPIRLFVYRSGHLKPDALAFEHQGVKVTWTDGGHVNPSFSRDGKRLYYNRPVNNIIKQAYVCSLSEIITPD